MFTAEILENSEKQIGNFKKTFIIGCGWVGGLERQREAQGGRSFSTQDLRVLTWDKGMQH